MSRHRIRKLTVWGLFAAGLSGVGCASGCTQRPAGVRIAPGDLNSGLRIPPRQQFVLGENEQAAFTAEAQNLGSVPVVLALWDDGALDPLAELAPGAIAAQRFERGQTAVFINRSDQEASLYVAVRGDTELGMRYEAAK